MVKITIYNCSDSLVYKSDLIEEKNINTTLNNILEDIILYEGDTIKIEEE